MERVYQNETKLGRLDPPAPERFAPWRPVGSVEPAERAVLAANQGRITIELEQGLLRKGNRTVNTISLNEPGPAIVRGEPLAT